MSRERRDKSPLYVRKGTSVVSLSCKKKWAALSGSPFTSGNLVLYIKLRFIEVSHIHLVAQDCRVLLLDSLLHLHL